MYLESLDNKDVLPVILRNPNSCGVLAVETQCRLVSASWSSLMGLLDLYSSNRSCPVNIAGSVILETDFCLMARKGVFGSKFSGILCHEEAGISCQETLRGLGGPVFKVSSNGEAAELVSKYDEYANFCAVGPRISAEKFGLQVIRESIQDTETWTRFFYLVHGDYSGPVIFSPGTRYYAWIVFELGNWPNALALALLSFGNNQLNITQMQCDSIEGKLRFAIEVRVMHNQVNDFNRAVESFYKKVAKALVFGPFSVIC